MCTTTLQPLLNQATNQLIWYCLELLSIFRSPQIYTFAAKQKRAKLAKAYFLHTSYINPRYEQNQKFWFNFVYVLLLTLLSTPPNTRKRWHCSDSFVFLSIFSSQLLPLYSCVFGKRKRRSIATTISIRHYNKRPTEGAKQFLFGHL